MPTLHPAPKKTEAHCRTTHALCPAQHFACLECLTACRLAKGDMRAPDAHQSNREGTLLGTEGAGLVNTPTTTHPPRVTGPNQPTKGGGESWITLGGRGGAERSARPRAIRSARITARHESTSKYDAPPSAARLSPPEPRRPLGSVPIVNGYAPSDTPEHVQTAVNCATNVMGIVR